MSAVRKDTGEHPYAGDWITCRCQSYLSFTTTMVCRYTDYRFRATVEGLVPVASSLTTSKRPNVRSTDKPFELTIYTPTKKAREYFNINSLLRKQKLAQFIEL